ncbi:hypothetical protein G7Y89_g4986 [Cudoniella acicularis]|uniref:Amidohydrolase-related domain-containing protein n=1 Tax=Cudoniella acicularis TaxID=354080 RepID=A0A8H4W4F0_9HELO|nr:hypothetical protein G7Y89_g4986 [Cudoniella acicularis]
MASTEFDHESLIKPWKASLPKSYIFTNANLIDPVDGIIRKRVTVKISRGIIEDVNDSASPTQISNISADSITIDLEGKYICPGLFDCHVHIIAVPGEEEWRNTKHLDLQTSAYRQAYVCESMLSRGFTTVRDCGGASLALKKSIEDGLIQGPRLFIAGDFLSQSGGHGDTRGPHDKSDIICCRGGSSNFPSKICDGVPECLRAARENIRTGSDFLKIMGGGGVCSPTDRIDNIQFTAEEVQAITTVARHNKTYATSHAYTPESIQQAINNGVMGIEHGNLIDKETAGLMASKSAYLTPTLVTYSAMAQEKHAGYMPRESMAKNSEVFVAGLHGLKIASEAGVNICFGTDLLGHLTASQSEEFSIRSQVLSPLAILQSATVTPARMMGQEGFLGQIKPGFAADMLILNSNPLEDIEVLANPGKHMLAVLKEGRVCKSRWRRLDEDVRKQPEYIE